MEDHSLTSRFGFREAARGEHQTLLTRAIRNHWQLRTTWRILRNHFAHKLEAIASPYFL